MTKTPPQTKPLFQYRPPKRWAFDGLRMRTLRFTPPAKFNDPYDCNTVPRLEELTESHLSYILKELWQDPQFREKIPVQSPDDVLEIFRSGRNKAIVAACKREIVDASNKNDEKTWKRVRTSQLGVSCLSACNDNLLMWSHYADRGRGICLEFNHQSIQSLFAPLMREVQYTKIPPDADSINLWQGNVASFLNMLSYKSKDWQHEQEMRLFIFKPDGFKKNERYVRYPQKALKSVYLGSEADAKTEGYVRAALKEAGSNAKLFKGHRSKSEYKIEFTPLL